MNWVYIKIKEQKEIDKGIKRTGIKMEIWDQ